MSVTTQNNTPITLSLFEQYYDNGWSFNSDTGVATHSGCNDGYVYRSNLPIQVGRTYSIVYQVHSVGSLPASYVRPYIGSVAGPIVTTTGTKTAQITVAPGSNILSFLAGGDISILIKSVSELKSNNGTTLAYSENTKGFTTFYSYVPEKMASILSEFITFKNGKPYLHDVNNGSFNTFYGEHTDSEILYVFNNAAEVVKTFLSIAINGTAKWVAVPTSHGLGIETTTGQFSELIAGDFDIENIGTLLITKKEGVYYANLLRDSGSEGGLLDGDFLKGNWIKIRLTNGDQNFVSLWSVFLNAVK